MRALILAADGFEDSELLYPYHRCREEGIAVDIAGPAVGTVTGKHGYTADVGLTFEEADAAAYDLLVLPGGKAPEAMRVNDAAVALTADVCRAGKVVAAICHGPQMLISAGVLEGRTATCYKGVRDDLKLAGADYVDEEVVVDGNLITSRTPDDLPAFWREVMKALGS